MTKYEIFKRAENKLLFMIASEGKFSDIERHARVEKYIVNNFEQPRQKARKNFHTYSKVD